MHISRRPTTLVFPVEDLGAPPDRGFGALGPSENTLNFLKRRYAAHQNFFRPSRGGGSGYPYPLEGLLSERGVLGWLL